MEFRILGHDRDRGLTEEASLTFSFSPHPSRVHDVRNRVRAFARERGVGPGDLSEFLTAVGEAVANAIEHCGTEAAVELVCRRSADRIVATVRDFGVGLPAAIVDCAHSAIRPPLDAERGRGIGIMRACSDIFSMRAEPNSGSTVTVGRLLRPAGTAPAERPEREQVAV